MGPSVLNGHLLAALTRLLQPCGLLADSGKRKRSKNGKRANSAQHKESSPGGQQSSVKVNKNKQVSISRGRSSVDDSNR
ncbi:hypothetical protein BDD14_5546 [Edaphobacter modestus]|uniref:Uncharacterized protein n=1 Tax=Edaphobacter modestus TaxID=388466 RepID=A0A4Q7YG83_9BACT|nr:hypothetical protein BDD14_5546 [Edaphobacter modestus]